MQPTGANGIGGGVSADAAATDARRPWTAPVVTVERFEDAEHVVNVGADASVMDIPS